MYLFILMYIYNIYMKHNVWKLILCNKVIFGPNVDKTPSEGDASISLTTGDSWKGCWGSFLVFSVCMYVCVFGGDEVWC